MSTLATDNADVLILNSNILALTNSVLSASQTPNAVFPISRLVDDRPSQRFIFPAVQDDDFITADLQQVPNGSLDNWSGTPSIPTGFTVTETGAGAVTEEVVTVVTGSALNLASGGAGPVNNAEAQIEFTVTSGAELELRASMETSNAADAAPLEVYNVNTGMYLSNTGVWVPTRQNVFEETSTVYVANTLQFVVEDYDASERHEVTLRIRAHMDGVSASRTYLYDNIHLIPAFNFVSVHAQNFERAINLVLSHSEKSLPGAVPVDASTETDGSAFIGKTDAEFNGLIDSRRGIFSCWFQFNNASASEETFISNDLNRFRVRRTGTGAIEIEGQNSAGTPILNMITSTLITDTLRHHIVFSWDLPNTTGESILDGVSDLAGGSTFTDDDIDYAQATVDWRVMAADGGLTILDGSLGELFFYGGQYLNMGEARNLLRFRTAQGRAQFLGTDGSIPIGSVPHIYLRNGFDAFTTNASGAGNFNSTTGTLLEDVNRFDELTLSDPTFYCKKSVDVYSRFVRLRFVGEQAGEFEIGQWALGKPDVLLRNPVERDIQEVEMLPLEVQTTRIAREKWTTLHSKQSQRQIRMVFSHKNVMQEKLAELVWRRTRFGADMSVVVADTTKPDVLHCSVERNEIQIRRSSVNLLATELRFRENPQGITGE